MKVAVRDVSGIIKNVNSFLQNYYFSPVPMVLLICSYSKARAFSNIHLILYLSPTSSSFPHKWGLLGSGAEYDIQIGRDIEFSAGLF